MAVQAQAGWYPDPDRTPRLRWWDGNSWTEYRHEPNVAPSVPGTTPARFDANAKPPGPSLAFALVLLIVGAIAAIGGGIVTGAKIIGTVTSSKSMTVPGEGVFHLDKGRYAVYELTGTSTGGSGIEFTSGREISIPAQSVIVEASTGETLAVRQTSGVIETITKGSRTYTAAVEFDVPSEGDYSVEVLSGRPGGALVARSLGDAFGASAGWIGLAVLGGAGGVRRGGSAHRRIGSAQQGQDRGPGLFGWVRARVGTGRKLPAQAGGPGARIQVRTMCRLFPPRAVASRR